ncbi:MAG: head GIN domain-containing protein, partial [Bacteroidota bacterium]
MRSTILYPICLFGLLLINACGGEADILPCVDGEGPVVSQNFNVSAFSGLTLAISANVTITQGDEQSVSIMGQQNILDALALSVSNSNCTIEFNGPGCFNYNELTIEITVPDMNQLELVSSGIITLNDFEDQDDLDLRISGSGNINLNSYSGAANLEAEISGSGNIIAFKTIMLSNTATVTVSGSGTYQGFNIIADNYIVTLSGSGNIELTANDA